MSCCVVKFLIQSNCTCFSLNMQHISAIDNTRDRNHVFELLKIFLKMQQGKILKLGYSFRKTLEKYVKVF